MKDKEKEIRLSMQNCRAVENENNKMIVEGYAVRFDEPATCGFTEVICKGSFDECDMSDVPLKYNHNDTWLIIARTRNKSLSLTVDDEGLYIQAELIDTQANTDIYKSIRSGLLDKMSFAFFVAEEEWDYESETRRITKIEKLLDVSVVDTPWYDTTSIYARALQSLESGKKELDSSRAKKELEVKKKKVRLKIKIMEEN